MSDFINVHDQEESKIEIQKQSSRNTIELINGIGTGSTKEIIHCRNIISEHRSAGVTSK